VPRSRPVIGDRLRACGIADTDALLAATKTPKQRKALAERSGLGEKRVLKFAKMADLYRIGGLGVEYAELLEAAGVDTVPQPAQRNPIELAKMMTRRPRPRSSHGARRPRPR
jgi:predicted flap endonuclease-1-like 5' DNA nuclease